jgi:hypothetical protein
MNTDMSKVEAFAGQVVADIAAAFSGVMTNIGHKLGLYKALAGAGWVTSNQLADKTGTDERYVREWLQYTPPEASCGLIGAPRDSGARPLIAT